MPAYQFLTSDNEVVELHMTISEHGKRVKNDTIILDDGRTAKTDWSAYSFISTVPANFPMVSTAAGVHPAQIKEHMDHLRKMGCGQVNHTRDGDVIFEDKSQRRKVCEALGLYDRNAGPSDPTPKIRTASCRKFR